MDAARALNAAFDRLVRRARVLGAAEAAGWGAAVASISPVAGGLVALAIGVWRAVRNDRRRVVGRADRAAAAANVLVTADEVLRGTLAVSDRARARVLEDAADRLPTLTRIRPTRTAPAWRAAATAIVSWTVVAVMSTTGDRARALRHAVVSGRPRGETATAPLRVTVDVDPPPYTRAARSSITDPQELRVVEGSRVRLRSDRPIVVTHDGATVAEAFVAERTGYVTAKSGGAERVIPLVVTPDALPIVRVSAPGRDLVFADDSPRLAFEARATDDYGVRSLTLRFTKVSGSGEEYTFESGDIRLDLVKRSARDWAGRAERALSALGLKEGDMLVYRAVATDEKPGDRESSSDAYFVEISRIGMSAGDAFTLPEEETRYALSEQMLIVKTERLARQRASTGDGTFDEASLNLAVEQRAIRAEFVFMLGGEVEDEEVEAERSIELQAGRLANRGQRDLRDATRAMSQAETLLTGGNPAAALAAERTAVSALQRAFARDRYLLRALASRAQLDPSRRLTGSRADARDVRVALPAAPENRRAARLEDLLQGIGDLARDRALGAAVDRARAAVLAETALRIDPDSDEMRRIAVDIQRGAMDDAAAAVGAATRRALADPPVAVPSTAPALRRAVDAAKAQPR